MPSAPSTLSAPSAPTCNMWRWVYTGNRPRTGGGGGGGRVLLDQRLHLRASRPGLILAPLFPFKGRMRVAVDLTVAYSYESMRSKRGRTDTVRVTSSPKPQVHTPSQRSPSLFSCSVLNDKKCQQKPKQARNMPQRSAWGSQLSRRALSPACFAAMSAVCRHWLKGAARWGGFLLTTCSPGKQAAASYTSKPTS